MAVLGQIHPAPNEIETLYTVGADTKTTIQLLHVCSTNTSKPDEIQAIQTRIFTDNKTVKGERIVPVAYVVDDVVILNNQVYVCISGHTSSAANKPIPAGNTEREPADAYLILNWNEKLGVGQTIQTFLDVELRDGENILVLSRTGKVTFTLFGKQEYDADSLIRTIASKIAAGTASEAEKEQYALLTGGSYNKVTVELIYP